MMVSATSPSTFLPSFLPAFLLDPLFLLSPLDPSLSREIFGNIPSLGKLCFYLAALAAMAWFVRGVWRRARLWRLGRPAPLRIDLAAAARRVAEAVFLQRRLFGRGRELASVAHALLFGGFCVLFLGTVLVFIEHVLQDLLGRSPREPIFHRGLYFLIYEAVLDLAGLAFLSGCGILALRRRFFLPPSVSNCRGDIRTLALFAAIGASGFLVEGLRIIRESTPAAQVSFVGWTLAELFSAAGIDTGLASSIHFLLWWIHAALALWLVAVFPYLRLLHAIGGFLNHAAKAPALGALELVSIEEVEARGSAGVAKIQDFRRLQLLEMDACVSCGRCEDACPAFEAGKPLSPRDVVQELRHHLRVVGEALAPRDAWTPAPSAPPELHGEVVRAETLWSCTACSACAEVCPLGVNPVGMIFDLRRHLIGEGQLRGAPAQALQKMQRSGNPWGLSPGDRMAWAAGLNVPTVAERPDFEVLYWVGCAAAYDKRLQRVARAVVKLLEAAGVSYAVLGEAERCTGESARRMGEEFVFQELAQANIEALGAAGVRRILTHCPHCLNSFRQDYPQLGGRYEVQHHSEFLAQLVSAGRLPRPAEHPSVDRVTYHDPCYLSRVQGIVEAPRELIAGAAGKDALVEMPRRGGQTACCGGGGGRMWFDDKPEARVGQSRVREALATQAEAVVVGCPFCSIMLRDGIAARGVEVEVRDLAEILLEALQGVPAATAVQA